MSTKRLILLGCIPLLSITGLRAQNSVWSVSASVGAALPVGKFGGGHFDDPAQSLALTGLTLNAELDYRLNSRLGVALSLSGQDNPVNALSIEQQIERPNPSESVSIGSGSWKMPCEW